MSQSCPISLFKVDAKIANDFFVRLFVDKKYSLVYHLSKVIKKVLRLKTEMVDGGAKRMATYFGFVFVLLLVIQAWLHLSVFLYLTAAILLTCTTLEILFNYCVGCKIYYLIKKIYPDF